MEVQKFWPWWQRKENSQAQKFSIIFLEKFLVIFLLTVHQAVSFIIQDAVNMFPETHAGRSEMISRIPSPQILQFTPSQRVL